MVAKKPEKIGKYDLLDVIGRGGMGIVYKATDPFLDRLVAIKMMTLGYSDHPDLLKRFFREAQSTGSLQHPNIVTVYELGEQGGNPYLVMEFLEGGSLDSIISSGEQLTLLEKINIIIEVCHGLSYAHNRGIVHRDIKPANIMVSKERGVKIVDFGIAHIASKSVTRTGQIMGSISYMAPEQVNGKPVDARTDVFSTGVVLYQLFTYNHPFDGDSTAATLLKIIHEQPPPLKNFLSTYPPELETIIFKALAKDRDLRYLSADDLALDLSQLQGRLKQEIIAKHLEAATLLLEKADLYKTREQLLQALKIDRQNTDANLLLREVQHRIQKEEVGGQVQQLRALAEDAYAQEDFEKALGHLESALSLDKENGELQKLRESIQTAWARALEFQETLKRAEAAVQAGDLDSAKQALEEALELSPGDVKAKTLYRSVQREWVERSRQRQVEGYLEQARREIAARNFAAALEILKQSDVLDPDAPQVKALIESATAGREQERRRRGLEAINRQIEDALNRDDYLTACQKADEGLQSFPEERTLLKLKTIAEKQRQIADRKKFVDQQLANARTLLEQGRSEELLSVLEAALKETGPEPRLQSLFLMARDNVQHERIERRKAEYLQKAKDALRQKSYDEAINILQTARAELEDAAEIVDLLQFAKEEAIAEQRRHKVEVVGQKANDFIVWQEYEQAIKLLEATLQEVPDEELRIILAEARRAFLDYQKKLETTLSTAKKLLQTHKAAEAVRLLESHSAIFTRSPAFQELLEAAHRDSERFRKIEEVIAKANQALQKENYAAARALLQECRQQYGSTAELEKQLNQVTEKQSLAAEKAVQKTVGDAQVLVMANQYGAALERLAAPSNLLALVSPAVKSEYESLQKQASDGLARQRVAQFDSHIAAGEFTQAGQLLRQTLQQFPGNSELLSLQNVLRDETNRRSEAQQSLAEAQQLFKNAGWKTGGELLRKAFGASERAPAVREQVLLTLVQAAESAVAVDWRASEALLQQLVELQPRYVPPVDLQSEISQRKHQEFVNQCLQQAKRLQSSRDLQGALREVELGLSGYGDESQLVDLRKQIQEQIRQEEERGRLERARLALEAFVQDVTRRVQGEPLPDRRVRILEEALARYQQEPRLQQQLSETRELWKRVTAIVTEARALEQAKKYGEAVRQWNVLRSVHAQYPDLSSNLARVTKLDEQARTAAESAWIQSVQDALVSADYDQAADLLTRAKSAFPENRELSDLEKKLQAGIKLRAKAQKIIADGHEALAKRKWEKAADCLTSAYEMADRDPAVREQVLSELLEGSEAALDLDSGAAEMLLARAAKLQPTSPLLSPLKARIEHYKREQIIEEYMTSAVRAQSGGDLQGAVRVLEKGLLAYPNEPRLSQVKNDIELRLRQLEAKRQQQQELEKERARQVELDRQRDLQSKRQQELEREKTKAAEREREIVAARELERKREQERAQKELERQQEAERREEERRTREEVEKKRRAEAQKLAMESRRHEEELTRSGAPKTKSRLSSLPTDATVFSLPAEKTVLQTLRVPGRPILILKNRKLIIGAGLLALVLLAVWILIPGTVGVQITTTPVGATVRITPTGKECITPHCDVKLPRGKYEIETQLQGYESKTQTISVIGKGTNSVSITLQPLGHPAAQGLAPPPPPALPQLARMQINGWSRNAKVYLDSNLLGSIGAGGTFSASLTPAEHEIKVVDKNGESGTMRRSFAPGERAALAKKDFAVLPSHPLQPPAPSPEENDWQKIKDSTNTADVARFLEHYSNGVFRAQASKKLEDLYWAKATGSNDVAGFRDYLNKYPNGQYSQLAQREIARVDFEAVQTTKDPAAWEDFLRRYPAGAYHEQAISRLDDLLWARTGSGKDASSLRAYLQRLPDGRHAGEAQRHIDQLTRAVEHKTEPTRPQAATPVIDDKKAVLDVLALYQRAYEEQNVEKLKQIWPGMTQQSINGVADFFRNASAVKMSYKLSGEPQITANEAVVRFKQSLTFVLNGASQKPKPAAVIMRLKKQDAAPGAPAAWQIDSVR
jgi:eukaryotic-like serine/threonine-protein kinase